MTHMTKRLALLMLLLLAPTLSATRETNMRAHLEQAYTFQAPGDARHWLVLSGWAVANGWVPVKGFYLDGVLIGYVGSGVTTIERHDVSDIVKSWGWTMDDGQPKHCDVAWTGAPCEACMGLWLESGPVSPGVHTVALCVTGKGTPDLRTPPDVVCDTKTVTVQ